MSKAHAPRGRDPFPRAPLIAIGVMLAASVVTVAAVRLAGIPPARPADAPAAQVLDFRALDRPDGSVALLGARDDTLLDRVEPGTGGFVRGTLRGLLRERKSRGIDPSEPFRLVGRLDGRLTLEDPATGRRVDLESFGPTNAAAFARLFLEPAERTRAAPAQPSAPDRRIQAANSPT